MYQNFDENNFSWDNFGSSVGNAATGVFDYVSGALNATAANSSAVAAINAAQAQSIAESSRRKTQIAEDATKIIFVAVVLIALVTIFSIWKK